MDKKQAYCCLNCADLASCCQPCNECPSCCLDCENMSGCKATAYFDGSNFYKDFIFTFTNSTNYSIRNVDTNCEFGIINLGSGLTNEYSTLKKPGEECSTIGMVHPSINFCFEGYEYLTSYNGLTYSTERLCDGSYEVNYGDGKCAAGVVDSGATSCPNTDKVDDCPDFGEKECNVPECYPACNPTPCEDSEFFHSTYRSSRSAKIIFVNQVKLYNKKGEDVGNIIGATYDPCAASKGWFAPPCHFFAP